ncbi:MAG: hypothetical protein AAF492_21080, partial [Verrucomicrobiota bacterium]
MGIKLMQYLSIEDRLRKADDVVQRERGFVFFLRSTYLLIGFILFCFAADVIWRLNAPSRLFLILALMGLGAGAAAWTFWFIFIRRHSLEHVARLLENREPTLGSKIINYLQLKGQKPDTPLTEKLSEVALDQYAEDLSDKNFEQTATTRTVQHQVKKSVWVWAGFILLLIAAWRITVAVVPRFLDPYGDHPPFSLTQLEIAEPGPAGADVVYGKDLIVKASWSGHRPKEVFLAWHPKGQPEARSTLPMYNKGEEGFMQKIEGITEALEIQVETRSRETQSHKHDVRLILTPELDTGSIRIIPPAYTGLQPRNKNLDFKSMKVLKGTTLEFELVSNRPLSSGWVELQTPNAVPQRFKLERDRGKSVKGSFTAETSGLLRYGLIDIEQIASTETWEQPLTVTHDLKPSIDIQYPPNNTVVSLDYEMPVRIAALDDYGIGQVRFHRGLNQTFSPHKKLSDATPKRQFFQEEKLNLQKLGIEAGDTISLFAEAIDNA